MKAELELNLDKDGRPCIKIRHRDKDASLEQEVLGVFLKSALENGVDIVRKNGYVDSEGESYEDYEIQLNARIQ